MNDAIPVERTFSQITFQICHPFQCQQLIKMLMLAPILELFACLFKDFANPEC
jgi:hypothetical protein